MDAFQTNYEQFREEFIKQSSKIADLMEIFKGTLRQYQLVGKESVSVKDLFDMVYEIKYQTDRSLEKGGVSSNE